LLAGFQYILVDEYQDVDDTQYELISALAGRTLTDPDAKLGLLAVGDDDQSIYAFRGADVRFIRRFEKDYEAETCGLTSNYRSSRAILDASGRVIAGNCSRMKADMPIHVDHRRRNDPFGEKVHLIEADGIAAQTLGLLQQVKSWQAAGVAWNDIAVLGVNHEDLDAFRSRAEAEQIPLNVRIAPVDGKKGTGLPALWRMRECMMLLDWLRAQAGGMVSRANLSQKLDGIRNVCRGSVWLDLLSGTLDEYVEKEAIAEDWIEHLYETMAGCRRDGRVGKAGLWLSTIHAAKGTEHGHVAVAGSWQKHWNKQPEEARRLLYVGMTRAKRGLAVVDRSEDACPMLDPLRSVGNIDKVPIVRPDVTPPLMHYRVLGPADFDLGFAGRYDRTRVGKIAAALMGVRSGACLEWCNHSGGVLLSVGNCTVAKLSRSATQLFREQADRVVEVRVLGVYVWRKEDSPPERRENCVIDCWEVPLCEVVLRR
jgi:ATP-dependent DNA helicase RecQ